MALLSLPSSPLLSSPLFSSTVSLSLGRSLPFQKNALAPTFSLVSAGVAWRVGSAVAVVKKKKKHPSLPPSAHSSSSPRSLFPSRVVRLRDPLSTASIFLVAKFSHLHERKTIERKRDFKTAADVVSGDAMCVPFFARRKEQEGGPAGGGWAREYCQREGKEREVGFAEIPIRMIMGPSRRARASASGSDGLLFFVLFALADRRRGASLALPCRISFILLPF